METNSIQCGKVSDDFETLKKLCEKEAEHLKETLNLAQEEKIEIPFWTKDFPELIAIGTFYRKECGCIVYELDYSQTTL